MVGEMVIDGLWLIVDCEMVGETDNDMVDCEMVDDKLCW